MRNLQISPHGKISASLRLWLFGEMTCHHMRTDCWTFTVNVQGLDVLAVKDVGMAPALMVAPAGVNLLLVPIGIAIVLGLLLVYPKQAYQNPSEAFHTVPIAILMVRLCAPTSELQRVDGKKGNPDSMRDRYSNSAVESKCRCMLGEGITVELLKAMKRIG